MTFFSRRPLWLLVLAGGLIALAFALGYRLPWFDRHPGWGYFPALTNPRLVVEEIPDSVFQARYGQRFQLPENSSLGFDDYYRTNLKNVRSVGFQVTNDEFDDDIYIDLYPGPTAEVSDVHTPWRPHFDHRGYEYLELKVGKEKAYFKTIAYSTESALNRFYQYNYPKSQQDTLFIYHPNSNYRVYVR